MATECRWPGWPGFSREAMLLLNNYPWPGNVRELRNVIERAVYRWNDPENPIDAIQFDPFASPWKPEPMPTHKAAKAAPAAVATSHAEAANDEAPATGGVSREEMIAIMLDEIEDFRGAVDAHERAILNRALERNRFNQRATAKSLGLSYDQLRHCLKKHGLLQATG